MENYQVLARKYRPQTFSEVVGQETIITTLKNALRFKKIAHAYLFSGSRGTGKTTLARIFAKALNCNNLKDNQEPCNTCPACLEVIHGQSLDVIEIDGASNRGIDDIREINEMVGYVPSHGKYKIYIIDEVHMLTKEAFNALLKTLEEPPPSAKFFFATTEPHKVLPTIISRCQRFDLGRIAPSGIIKKLEQIAADLSRSVDSEALLKIADLADGSLRDAESLFDQVLCFTEETVSVKNIQEIFGLVSEHHFFDLDFAFLDVRLAFAFEMVDHLFQSGKDLSHFMSQLIDHYRNISLAKIIGESAFIAPVGSKYLPAAQNYTKQQSLYILEYLIQAQNNLQRTLSPRIFLETTLLHIIRSKNRIPVEVIARRLSELQAKEAPVAKEAPPAALENNPISPNKNLEKSPKAEIVQPPPTQPSKQFRFEEKSSIEKTSPVPQSIEEIHPKKEETLSIHDAPSLLESNEEKPLGELSQPPTHIPTPPQTNDKAPPKAKPSSKHAEAPPHQTERKGLQEPIVNSNIETLQASEEEKNIALEESASKHPSHYDTLMRFAAVELEGSLKT